MAFIPVPHGVQLCFDFTTASQLWQFCLMLRKSAGDPTSADLEQITTDAEAWWDATLKPFIGTGTTLRQVRATDMTVEGGPQNIETVGETGTASAAAKTLNVAAVISQRTAKRGRSYRGRAYLSGLTADMGGNEVDFSSTGAADLVSKFATLQTTLDGHGFDVVVASKQHNGVVTNPADVNEVIEFVVDTHWDSQRRRLAGRGT